MTRLPLAQLKDMLNKKKVKNKNRKKIFFNICQLINLELHTITYIF